VLRRYCAGTIYSGELESLRPCSFTNYLLEDPAWKGGGPSVTVAATSSYANFDGAANTASSTSVATGSGHTSAVAGPTSTSSSSKNSASGFVEKARIGLQLSVTIISVMIGGSILLM
jgi:hypothetical protein